MPDVEFRNVSKRYRRARRESGGVDSSSLMERWRRWHQRQSDFWALRDVNFQVEKGEALGIIGHNGAGKSTILKLLTRITAPTSGEIRIRGRLSALLEVGSGFHQEATGRENIYLSGVTFGMSRQHVAEKLSSIVEFSGVGEFIDVPVKRYSSGMYLRLGFAIMAHLDPDILLLDEVLAVGDVAFQAKCLDRIQELRRAGRTIIFVSHDLAAIERLCDRTLLLSRGQIVYAGKPRDVTLEYQRRTLEVSDLPAHVPAVSRVVECTHVRFHNATADSIEPVRTGDSMMVELDYVAHETTAGVVFNVYLYWPSGYLCTQLSTAADGVCVDKGTGRVTFYCPVVNLRPGLFLIDAAVERYPEVLDWRHRCTVLRVDDGPVVLGDLHMPHEFRIQPEVGDVESLRGGTNA